MSKTRRVITIQRGVSQYMVNETEIEEPPGFVGDATLLTCKVTDDGSVVCIWEGESNGEPLREGHHVVAGKFE